MLIAILLVAFVLYGLFHRHHYRRNRRRGLSVWVSCAGPFHTRISRRL
jgi:hypothetical protein